MATEKQVKFAEDLKKLLFVRLDDYLDKSERNISKFPPKISNHKETASKDLYKSIQDFIDTLAKQFC